MGLDQFAYSINHNSGGKEDLAYWRKHPNLHGWMEKTWESKGRPYEHSDSTDFNGIRLELTKEDLDSLKQDVLDTTLPETVGFFFGSDSDDIYRQQDLEFVEKAKKALDSGLTVVYDSSW